MISRLFSFELIESIYRFVHQMHKQSPQWIVSFMVASLGTISIEYFFDIPKLIEVLFVSPTVVIVLMWVLIVCGILLQLFDVVLLKYIQRHNNLSELKNIMIKNADTDCFDLQDYNTGYIWGQNRTIWVCNNILEGYKTQQIYLEDMNIDTYYQFPPALEKLNVLYREFCKTPKMQTIQMKQNNNDRLMLAGFTPNFSKRDKRLYVSFAKTIWSMNQFVWTNVFKTGEVDKLQELKKIATNHTQGFLANSFCLHLVIVSSDKKVIVNHISNNKSNDYPLTIAATIGEQIEISDIHKGINYDHLFVDRWIQRAFYEEFGIINEDYERIVNKESARVLAITEEGDIYNFAMVATIHLNYSYDDFKDYITTTIATDKEFVNIDSIELCQIPSVLANHFIKCHQSKLFTNADFHPSTAMRLFLTYVHHYGLNRFKNEYLRAEKKAKKK